MAGRATYSEAERARVYVVLTANQGNVKRTARDTGVPESTVRRFKQDFEQNGPPSLEEVEQEVGDFLSDAERVRHKALLELERKIPDATPSALVATVGVLTEKIGLVRGLATGRVEHVHSLPSPDEIRAALAGVVQGAIDASRQRQEEIIDADFEEQATKALPEAR